MKAVNYKDIPATVIEHEGVKNVTGRVLIGKADGAPNFCMRLFEVGKGGFAPRHSHEWEHEIFVLEGDGEVLIGDTWHPLSQGSVVFVPGNLEHQLKNTGDGTLRFICLVPPQAPEM